MSSFSDTFTGAAGALSGSWNQLSGTWEQDGSGNAYEITNGAGRQVVHDNGVADIQCTMTLGVVDANAATANALIIRCLDDNNFLDAEMSSNAPSCRTYKNVAGSFTDIGANNSGWGNGDTMYFEGSGNNLTLKRNSAGAINITESTHNTRTQHGMRAYNNQNWRTAQWDSVDPGDGGGWGPLLGQERSRLVL